MDWAGFSLFRRNATWNLVSSPWKALSGDEQQLHKRKLICPSEHNVDANNSVGRMQELPKWLDQPWCIWQTLPKINLKCDYAFHVEQKHNTSTGTPFRWNRMASTFEFMNISNDHFCSVWFARWLPQRKGDKQNRKKRRTRGKEERMLDSMLIHTRAHLYNFQQNATVA